MSTFEHAGIRKVTAALAGAGFAEAAAGVRVLDDDVRTAAAAAAALGVEVGAIANSLLFKGISADRDGAGDTAVPLLALTSGAHRADQRVLAELAGLAEVTRADPDFVRRHTGQVIGGVSPIGHPTPIRTLVDRALNRYPVVWAAAGHPKAVFPITFAGLVELTGGTTAEVAGQEDDRHP